MEPAFAPEPTRVSVRRLIAHMLDGVVIMLLFIVLAVPAAIVSDVLLALVLILLFTLRQVAYYMLLQRRAGQTPGKRAVGLRVVDAQGRTPGTGALVKRTLPLLIEYFYVFAWISMMGSRYRQRFGDRVGATYVVGD